MAQTATESIKYTPKAILPTPTVMLIQQVINTSRENQKRVGQLQNSLSQISYQFLPRKTSIQARDQSSTIKLIHSTLAQSFIVLYTFYIHFESVRKVCCKPIENNIVVVCCEPKENNIVRALEVLSRESTSLYWPCWIEP